jgi:beta-mannanase|tara:strand:+ start:314 stop:766 length:453 start_codon:yes stop_codon:yes gene_type:complete
MSKKVKKMLNNQNPYNMNNVQFTPEGQLKASGVTFSVKAQLGRPVNPNSARQQRLAKAPGRKTGRPVNPLSARQERLHQLDMKRIMNGGTVKRGRPVNANSERQLRLADLAARRAAGGVKRGRPVGSGKKGNTAITKTQTPCGVDVVVVG